MNRRLEAEWLDELPVADPQACGSRRDLRRLNWWMGHVPIMAKTLQPFKANRQVTELGAGDGHFLLSVAHALGSDWSGTRAVLLDRQAAAREDTLQAFGRAGWEVEPITGDVFDWCAEPVDSRSSIVIANLFLHHFDSERLEELLREIAGRSSVFIALEPRRSAFALLCSKMVWAIGCNAVTRHDAPASVRAGFRPGELAELWPKNRGWATHERPAGVFSHLFVAHQTNV